ncbi:hypothetical protein FDA94_28755 [Herbidospora galbida]|uniref:Uncharacterized protein n=1 Tax=Herbidospora galbida TaxID=2575442 RepID=A0A4U3M8I4_9ACTN|nr:hypothetical protein [Herbidospora galbida]TKK84622.1 hypothetical protein FDA94_28755 [Herbidospora galbida]
MNSVEFESGDVARFYLGTEEIRYTFVSDGAAGTITAKSAFFGEPKKMAVMLQLSDNTEIGDWGIMGVVLCDGHQLTARPHFNAADKYPLDGVDNEEARASISRLFSEIAWHYYEITNWRRS